jgi:hypothetical protein
MDAESTWYAVWSCGTLELLQQTLPTTRELPCRTCLVDYGCPSGSGKWARRQRHPRLVILEEVPRLDAARRPIPNRARALNAAVRAAHRAGVRWLVLSDPHVAVEEGLWDQLAAVRDAVCWCPREGVTSLLVAPVALLRDVRPCEAYHAAGGEDVDLRVRLDLRGVVLERRPDLAVRAVRPPPPAPLSNGRLLGQRITALTGRSPQEYASRGGAQVLGPGVGIG